MKIGFPSYYNLNTLSPKRSVNNAQNDSFELRSAEKSEPVSFGMGFFDIFLRRKEEPLDDYINTTNEVPSEFAKDLADGIKIFMEKDIPPQNLKNIMSPEEFKEILPSLELDNFTSSKKNKESGVYFIDLDYQSNFSRGKENVFDILDEVAKYADEYYAKTGREFIFALTDRDTLDGVKHAIRIVGENPEKFKHMKLLPAVKLSFAHEAPTSKLKYENSDMLIYGINPFSINLSNFVENTIIKRKQMILSFIKDVVELYPEFAYNVLEFARQNNLRYKRDFTVPNLYWRAREYAETKGDTAIKGISMPPKEVIAEAEKILNELDKIYVGSNKKGVSSSASDLITNAELNKSIKEVFEKYSTHMDEQQGKVVSSAENLFDDMIDCLSLEKSKPVLALSAPYYLSHYYEPSNNGQFPNVVEFINNLQERSNGMLLAFETVVPSYDLDKNLTPDTIKNFNTYIKENTDLYEVGGSFAKRV